jgi:hypothetical protein
VSLLDKENTKSKCRVLTEDKLVLGLNIPLENIADALRRKLEFKVSSFKPQVRAIFRKNPKLLWM